MWDYKKNLIYPVNIKNKNPTHNPIITGINASFPKFDEYSNEGKIKLKIAAATITPAANPEKAFNTLLLNCFLIFNIASYSSLFNNN